MIYKVSIKVSARPSFSELFVTLCSQNLFPCRNNNSSISNHSQVKQIIQIAPRNHNSIHNTIAHRKDAGNCRALDCLLESPAFLALRFKHWFNETFHSILVGDFNLSSSRRAGSSNSTGVSIRSRNSTLDLTTRVYLHSTPL